MKACDLKKGMVISIDAQSYIVKEIQVQSPSSRSGNTLYKVQYRNVVTKQKYDQSYKGEDVLQVVDFMRRAAQLLFRETDSCTFMDVESYDQYTLDNDALEGELPYMVDGMEGIYVMIADDVVLGVELPATVELEIVETAPGIKGASASARTKPATLSTGLIVQVPEYIENGERIKINTQSGEFMSRA